MSNFIKFFDIFSQTVNLFSSIKRDGKSSKRKNNFGSYFGLFLSMVILFILGAYTIIYLQEHKIVYDV